jgi:hypothetical protein
MSVKQFKDLQIEEVFTWNGIQYKKIPDEKVSCCYVNNAAMVDDPTKKTRVIPITEVEVND